MDKKMMFNVAPISDHLGMEVRDLDLTKLISADVLQQLIYLIHKHQVLVIRTPGITELDLLNFCSCFGNLSQTIEAHTRHPQYPELKILKSSGKDKVVAAPPFVWHQDGFNIRAPSRFTFLYGVEVPQIGGQTNFISTRYAYDILSDELKEKIENLRVIYKSIFIDAPAHAHPIIRVDELNQRKSLYINIKRALGIVGMEKEQAFALIKQIFDHVITAHEPYRHNYQVGDILMWDNYSVIHAASEELPPDQVRILYRLYIPGEETTELINQSAIS